MSYAVRKDKQGWRAVNGPEDVLPGEYYSKTQVETVQPPLTEEQTRQALMQADKNYLASTDYIVLKISEAVALGQDTSALLDVYKGSLADRESARIRIRVNEVRP